MHIARISTVANLFSSDMVCSVAGITSDANVLTNELRMIAQRFVFFSAIYLYEILFKGVF